jgi:hypothetical protein
MAFYEMGFP